MSAFYLLTSLTGPLAAGMVFEIYSKNNVMAANDQIPTAEEVIKDKKFPVKYIVAFLFMAALIGAAIFASVVVL